MQPQLPPGLTPDMLQAITAYMSAQTALARTATRPSGTLQASQIRGVDPRYSYQFREFPKALTPPMAVVENEVDERTFRARSGQPLPWPEKAMIDAYYAARKYPVRMQPLQVVVNSKHEEDARRAEWNQISDNRIAYPRYMFHSTEQPRMVNSSEEEVALGKGWYSTIKEATDDAMRESNNDRIRQERHDLLDKATKTGVKFDPSWGNKRIQDALDKVSVAA